MNFASNWNKLLKHCISAEFCLVEGTGCSTKEATIAPYVERFKTASLGRSC